MLMEILSTYGAQLLGAVLVALFGALGMALRNLAAKFLDSELKRTLARAVVQFAEQTCKELHGEEKLASALDVFAALLQEKGIHATQTEMIVLLEAAVAEFNNAFSK